jgi:hypothetical protein
MIAQAASSADHPRVAAKGGGHAQRKATKKKPKPKQPKAKDCTQVSSGSASTRAGKKGKKAPLAHKASRSRRRRKAAHARQPVSCKGHAPARATGKGKGASTLPGPTSAGASPPTGSSGAGESTPPETPPAPETPPPAPQSAQGEDFAEAPSDVLVTYPEAVTPGAGSHCVGIGSSGAEEGFGSVQEGPSAQTLRLYLVPGGMMPAKVRCPSLTGEATLSVATAGPAPGGVLSDPIDPKYLTELPPGTHSLWIQPWRAYMDTWPASRLTEALGVNFNVSSSEAEDTAQLLHESGFKFARIEIPWGSISYGHPTEFSNQPDVHERLIALHEHGLRPLFVLNANSGSPGPETGVTLSTVSAAPAGATSVTLTPESAAEVVPGKTGFNDLAFGGYPDILITSVNESDDVAQLAKPLTKELLAGAHPGDTLLYAPFGPPKLPSGEPNPAFEATLAGWLSYVATICHEAASIFGSGGYDLEVWNELGFGSQFLNEENYYSPARESGSGSVEEALLDRTVAYVRNPANGISPEVGITDGFADETPNASGASVPVGTTAISKHPYAAYKYFPPSEEKDSNIPINALGEPDYVTVSSGIFEYPFNPSFMQELPEYYLTGTQTETLIRDLAPPPLETSIGGVLHGRNAAPAGGSPPQVWVTEYNLDGNYMPAVNPADPVSLFGTADPEQTARIQAEVELRSLVSDVAKGIAREYFYAAIGADWNLVSEAFTTAVNAHPSVYPGSALGGETMASLARLIAQFQGPGPKGPVTALKLLQVAQEGNQYQFAGNGTAAFPDLYDRDMLAVFPFQASPTRFVIPVYVMTENMTTVYNAAEPEDSPSRFKMPNESFRITLGNLPETANPPAVSAYDPLTNEATPARFVSRKGSEAVFEVAATNYPRLLTLEYE